MPATVSLTSRFIDALERAFGPLWISGLVLLILFSVRLFHLSGERFDWTEYMLLGTVFPALVIALIALEKYRPGVADLLQKVRLGLAGLVILIPIFTIRAGNFKYILIISLVQWLIALQYSKRIAAAEGKQIGWERRVLRGLSLFVVITLSWIVVTKYIWWASYQEFILGANSSFIIFIVGVLLVVVSVYDVTPVLGEDRREPLRLIGNLAAIMVIAMACVRTDRIFGLGEIFHWMSFVGPSESVRQGGWLLWDVPSHYGFLSVLTLAWLPTSTSWQSLFLVNGLFNFLVALTIFFLFRALRPGFLNLLFALMITLAAVFFRSGLAVYYIGPNNLPNIGGLRFFWCFALVAILFWNYRFESGTTRPRRYVLWAGSAVWLIGTLWSVESAVYCSVIWLPAFAVLAWQATSASSASNTTWRNRLPAVGRSFVLPLALLLGAVVVISAIYFVRLGHVPDWRGYVEYARAYSGGFMALPINPAGEVWVLVLVFCAFATTAAYFLRDASKGSALLPLILGIAGGLWATGSYFVSRSHPNNVHNLSAIFCGVSGLTLYLLARERKDACWALLVRSSLVPVLAIVMVAVFAHKEALKDHFLAPQASYMKIERLIPVSDTALDDLMNSAGITPNDPIVYIGQGDLIWTYAANGKPEKFATHKSWLPIPLYSFVPLNDERRNVYLSRFTNRTNHMSGWLIEFKHPPQKPDYLWFSEYLKLHYAAGRTIENENWTLTWYDYKG